MARHANVNNAFFRQMIFVGLLILLGYIIFDQLRFFIGSFLGAFTLYIVLRNIHFTLTDKYRWRPWLSSLTLVAGMTVILAGIGFIIFEVTASELPRIDTSQISVKFHEAVQRLDHQFGFEVLSQNILARSSDVLTRFLRSALNTTYSFAANVLLMLLILYFMLANARKMEAKALLYQPFRGESLGLIEHEVKSMVFGNAVGIPVVMFAQGFTAWIIYMAYGFENALFWAFLTSLCGLIPMIGTVLVSAPLGIYLIAQDNLWGGIVLIALGLVVIANVDNLARIILLKKTANTHPLVVIFGVILGIPLFGFWGIIFGPLLISGFLLLIKIYYREYGLASKCALEAVERGAGDPKTVRPECPAEEPEAIKDTKK